MNALKIVALWVRPSTEEVLPEASARLEGILAAFEKVFPEYAGVLVFSQSPRPPRYIFVYVNQHCNGLLPPAGQFLQERLRQAFPGSEVRPYGKIWWG